MREVVLFLWNLRYAVDHGHAKENDDHENENGYPQGMTVRSHQRESKTEPGETQEPQLADERYQRLENRNRAQIGQAKRYDGGNGDRLNIQAQTREQFNAEILIEPEIVESRKDLTRLRQEDERRKPTREPPCRISRNR